MTSISGLTNESRSFYYFWLNAHEKGLPLRLSWLDLHKGGSDRVLDFGRPHKQRMF